MRRGIIAALFGALALLAGCSTLRLVYNQAPELAYWWLDRYFDFNEGQTPKVRAALADALRWHRSNQLAADAAFLQRARAEVLAPVTAPQVCHWFDDTVVRVETAFEHVLPAVAELVPTLTAAQLVHLERKYDKNNEKFADDFLQREPAKRLKAAVKRSIDNAETLYGSLDRTQLERISAAVAQSPFDPQVSADERKRLHRDVLDTLRRLKADGAASAQIQAALRALVQRARASPNEEHRAYQQRLVQYNCAFAAQVHNSTTPEQRQRAAKKLKGWEDDLRSLLPAA